MRDILPEAISPLARKRLLVDPRGLQNQHMNVHVPGICIPIARRLDRSHAAGNVDHLRGQPTGKGILAPRDQLRESPVASIVHFPEVAHVPEREGQHGGRPIALGGH